MSFGHVPLGTETGRTCDSDTTVDTADAIEAIEDTSLDEAPRVMLPDSQEHGDLSSEQQ